MHPQREAEGLRAMPAVLSQHLVQFLIGAAVSAVEEAVEACATKSKHLKMELF